ncbi:hypothetical protein [Aromatoleum toluclasticum]|uniref:hypothetical protein n=1 Tax=Aromatoleum toluclasticum TaxID=92003 RepID=UPI0012F7BFD3|nr:hypothetical protein [Aromatoleum toluclasticum]
MQTGILLQIGKEMRRRSLAKTSGQALKRLTGITFGKIGLICLTLMEPEATEKEADGVKSDRSSSPVFTQ